MTSNNKSSLETNDLPFQPIEVKESKLYLISKRATDLFISILALIILSPLIFIVSILIKLDDRTAPILFKQLRVGKDGTEFYMYKYRSMVLNAEDLKEQLIELSDVKGPVFKMKDDPRITKIGKFIRKTSIDELPQIINVIKGEMSLVGPRPPLPSEVACYTTYELQRLSVTPGLTCYWQVNGRNSIEFHDWVELDLKYIRERNYMVDLILIFKTVFVLFGSKNAF